MKCGECGERDAVVTLTQVVEGEECNGRVTLFGELSEEVQARNGGGHKPDGWP